MHSPNPYDGVSGKPPFAPNCPTIARPMLWQLAEYQTASSKPTPCDPHALASAMLCPDLPRHQPYLTRPSNMSETFYSPRRWHTGTSTQFTPETPDLEINAPQVSANYNLLQIATLRTPNFISVRNSSLLSPMTYNTKQTPALDCAP